MKSLEKIPQSQITDPILGDPIQQEVTCFDNVVSMTEKCKKYRHFHIFGIYGISH